MEDLSLWDVQVPQSMHEYLDVEDCLSLANQWDVAKEPAAKQDVRVKGRVEWSPDLVDEGDLLFDNDSQFCDWMEAKFSFEEYLAFNSPDDVERLLTADEPALDHEQTEVVPPSPQPPPQETSSPPAADLTAIDILTKLQYSPEEESLSQSHSSSEYSPNSSPSPSYEILSVESTTQEDEVINSITIATTPKSAGGKIAAGSRQRSKPYARPKSSAGPDKKNRKRNQNRDAATRYRSKKKEEAEVLALQEAELQAQNSELNKQVDSLSTEINYLKNLMRELIQAKNKK